MANIRMLNGYKTVYMPEHARSMHGSGYGGFVYEHILVAEKFLGRPLEKNEVCHHLDGDRSNNRLGNILVLQRSQHTKLHSWMRHGAPGVERSRVERVNSRKSKGENNQDCLFCGRSLESTQTKFCSNLCRGKFHSKCPTKAVLLDDLEKMSREAIGRKYGVTGNAVKKWAIKLGLL